MIPTLIGPRLVLEPLDERHREGLRLAAKDPQIWRWAPVSKEPLDSTALLDLWLDRALDNARAGREIPFAVRRVEDGRLVGSSRYLNIAPEHRRLEIGSTWYAPDVWGTAVNPAAKLLLMTHAFETLDCVRVELKCDARNARSRAAIARLGAKEEGTLRRHMILADGFIRDTVYFSVLAEEWPSVKAGLVERIR